MIVYWTCLANSSNERAVRDHTVMVRSPGPTQRDKIRVANLVCELRRSFLITWASVENGHDVGASSSTSCARAKALMIDSTRPPSDFLRNESSAALSNLWAIAGSCTGSPTVLVLGSHAVSTA